MGTLNYNEKSTATVLNGGNPGANIPGLNNLIKSLASGYLNGSSQTITTSATVLDSVVFIYFSGATDGAVATVPEAANAKGKIFFAYNAGSNGKTIKDDADSPHTLATLTTVKGAILYSDGSSWLAIPVVTA